MNRKAREIANTAPCSKESTQKEQGRFASVFPYPILWSNTFKDFKTFMCLLYSRTCV